MSVIDQIRHHIGHHLPRDVPFTADAFTAFGARGTVNQALSLLEATGFIRRVGTGVYLRPLDATPERPLTVPTSEDVQRYLETHIPEGQPFRISDLAALGPRQTVGPALARLMRHDTVRRVSIGTYVRPAAEAPPAPDTFRPTGSEQLLLHLKTHIPRGQPFTAASFDAVLPRVRSQNGLNWLARTQQITRVRRGVFVRPLEDQPVTETPTLAVQVRQQIERVHAQGQPFGPQAFHMLGSREQVSRILSRLVQRGWLIRVDAGVYRRLPDGDPDTAPECQA